MAKLEQVIEFTGSLGNVSAYRMRGVDRIILRKKGGASKKKIKSSPAFEKTRLINAEFGGKATASKWIMNMLFPLKALADYNISGPLNALMKPVQMLDTVSPMGQRNIILSKIPAILEGFTLNRETLFDSVVRAPLSAAIDKQTLSAQISFPELIPGINFMPAQRHPFYSFTVVLGVIPDLLYGKTGYRPPHQNYTNFRSVFQETPWLPITKRYEATTLELKLPTAPPDTAFTLILSMGIRYGTATAPNVIEQVKYAGSAKVARVS